MLTVTVVFAPRIASAHIGSPDVFLDAQAGPYRALVTVRPPWAVPGVADVDILVPAESVTDVRIVPLPLTGPGAQFAPTPDVATRAPDDPTLFRGHLWMMSAGAWQVRVTISGDRGTGTLSVPVPTLPQATLGMTRPLRAALFAFMFLLCAGFVSIVSATAREARLAPGETPGPANRRRGRIAGALSACACIAVVLFGNWWWGVEASSYDRYVYKSLQTTPAVTPGGSLTLPIRDPGWIASRRVDDFVPDHDHLMHLFVVSPQLDRFWHLHPEEESTGTFVQRLPRMPQGQYDIFGDLVHATGVPETVTGTFSTAAMDGVPLAGDDSAWSNTSVDNGRIVWVRDSAPLAQKKLTLFAFRVDDANGRPAEDLELYMGMPGHAVFVKRDRRVFAHVHPSGSAPMAALQIAMPSAPSHAHHDAGLPSTVTFPYGFPESGDYRIFVQVKRRGAVLTAAFDAHVD